MWAFRTCFSVDLFLWQPLYTVMNIHALDGRPECWCLPQQYVLCEAFVLPVLAVSVEELRSYNSYMTAYGECAIQT